MAGERIQQWLSEWAAIWHVPDLRDRVRVEPTTRLRRSLGRCMPGSGRIRIQRALLDGSETLLREVVCHEAAHAAAHLLHGARIKPHGAEWRRLMAEAGYRPRVRIALDDLPPALRDAARPKKVWRHACAVCGAFRDAGRPVRAWRCRGCYEGGRDGRLEITSRPYAATDPC